MPCAISTVPAADVERRRDDVVDAEPLHREDDADDVDDGVERTDLVEMDLFDRHVVDRRFGLAEPLEERHRSRFALWAQRGMPDQVRDFTKRSMASLAGTMTVCVGVRGFVSVSAGVRVRVIVGMAVTVVGTMVVVVRVLVGVVFRSATSRVGRHDLDACRRDDRPA